jgi:hypothetical protein
MRLSGALFSCLPCAAMFISAMGGHSLNTGQPKFLPGDRLLDACATGPVWMMKKLLQKEKRRRKRLLYNEESIASQRAM